MSITQGHQISSPIVFVGDFCLSGTAAETECSPQADVPWGELRKLFGDDASLVANLECPFTDARDGLPYKWANLKMLPRQHDMLNGLSIAVLGNNHIGDFGSQGVIDTKAILKKKGIKFAGVGASLGEALEPAITDVNGSKIGVVSLCCPTTNSEYLATHHSPGVAVLGKATLHKAIQNAKSQCDVLVVYMHWGCEWVHDPVPEQISLARYAIDCGADAVVGCHSHTIQSFEQYRGRWIFYGIGNYLFKPGNAQKVLENGEIEVVPLSLGEDNRESLAVSFRIATDNEGQYLVLDRVQPMKFDDNDLTPRPISLSELTFDLQEVNRRLQQYVEQHVELLCNVDEPVFLARLLNGSTLAYWYSSAPIGEIAGGNFFKHLSAKISSHLRNWTK